MDEGGGSEGSAVVYVGHNLPESITKDHVLQHFKAFVPHINILRSTIITNKAGKRHGKLFFTNDAAAGQAVSQMNGTQIRGFKLHVNHWAPKKKESEADVNALSQFLHQRAEATPHRAVVDDDNSDDSQSDISSISIGSTSSIMSDSDGSYKAYVGANLPGRIQDSTLKTQLQVLGFIVKSLHVITSKKNRSRFAIVAFSSQEALDQAVKQLNGTKMLGYKLSVSCWVDKKVSKKGKGSSYKQRQGQTPEKQEVKLCASGTGPSDLCTVILKGVPSSVDNSLLRTICKGYGKVSSLHMNTGDGTAYVSYPTPELAATAGSQLNGLTCGGGRLTVVPSASGGPAYSGYIAPASYLDSGYGTSHQPPYQSSLRGPVPLLQGPMPTPQGHGPPLQGSIPAPHHHYGASPSFGPLPQGHGLTPQGYITPPQSHGQGVVQPGHGQFPQPSQPGGAYPPPAQYHMQPSSHISDGRQRTPAGSLPGPSMQAHYHSEAVSVKVSNLHIGVTEEELKGIFSFVASAVVAFHRTPGNKPNYAHINCADQADAGRVVESLKGRKFHGMPVSVKIQKGKEQSVPPPPASAPLLADMETAASVKVFHSGVVSVKVSNLHVSITEEELKGILSFVPSTVVLFHPNPGKEPNYAHINCANQADADRVVESLKGREFHGMPVSVKIRKGKEQSVPPPATGATLPVYTESAVAVKLSRLPKSVTEKQIRKHISSIQGISSVVPMSVPNQEHNYAYVNCDNGFAAQQVVHQLDGMKLLGTMIKATVQQSKTAKKKEEAATSAADTAEEGQEMSKDLYDFFQQRFSKDIASFEARGGTLLYSDGFLTVRGPETEVNEFYRNTMEPMKDGSQALTADQWGQLMAAKKGGTTLFQELSSPFLHNPNVKIDRRENPFMLVIVGIQKAVDAARSHFFSKMDSKLVVDRVKLFALTHLKPGLPDVIEAECGVNVSGFNPGSSQLALDSEGRDLTRARMWLLGELEAVFVHKKTLSLKCNLVASAQRFIESHKTQVVMCSYEHGALVQAIANHGSNSADEQLQVTLCGKPRETVTYVYHSLCAKPSCETVTMSASQFASLNDSTENSMEKLQQEYGIVLSYSSDEGVVKIQGFIPGDVRAVFRILYNNKQTVCKTQALDCSRNEAMYLNHTLLKNPTEEGEELLAALQDECGTTVRHANKRILLVGPASSLDSAAMRIKESSLFKGAQSKVFQYFGCNPALLTDLKSTVHRLEESHEVVAVLSVRQEKDKRPSNVDVTLLGNNVESFDGACQALQDINPSSKARDMNAAEARQLKDDFFRQLETDHPVHIHLIHSKNLLIVQSLWPSAILLTFSAIDEFLKDTVKVLKEVPVSVAQLHFLREKRTSEVDNDALQVAIVYPESYSLRHKKGNDLVHLRINGLQHFVESAAEAINEILNGFDCIEEELQVESKYQWTREWKEATKQAIEAECDVIVEFPKSEGKGGSTHSETFTVLICFSYVNENALQQAKVIVSECTTLSSRSVAVDRAQQEEILKALKDRKLTCAGTHTSVQLNKAEGVVNIISPLRFPNGVEEMEDRLMQYIRKELSISADVALEPPLSVLIQSRHYKDLKKDIISVFFKFTPNRVSLSGKTADVEAAKERLKGLVTQLEASMCTQLVPVPKCLQIAIATTEVQSDLNRFGKAHNVLIEVPKDITCIQNELKWEAKVRPEGWSQTCTIQLLHGSLTKEDTDAIVNAANENLELMGGLAGSILKAGGSAIQEECTKYTDVKGPINVGDAVCLGSGNLPCKKVIHAVGPRWQGGKSGEGHMLQATYIRSLEVAVQNGCQSIAFPAISTGLFHFPVESCAQSAVRALTYYFSVNPDRLSTVKFVLFREADVPLFQAVFQASLANKSFNTSVVEDSSTSVTAGVKSVPMWMWEDDSGRYQCFTDNLNAQLEQQFANSPSGSFPLQRGKWSYTMNLGAMTQRNNETGKTRRLQRNAVSLSSQWYWKDDSGQMQPYKPSESITIENIRLKHDAGNTLSINGQNYMFDFDRQRQVNVTTGHKRRIEYRAGQQPEAAMATATASCQFHHASPPPQASETGLAIVVKGCTKDVNTAVVQIQTHIEGMRGSEVLQFSKKFAQKMEGCLQDVCARLYVDVDFKNKGPQDRAANLIGWKVSVSKAVEEGRKRLIELMQAGSAEEVSTPPEWDGDVSPGCLKQVNPSSAEFNKVLSLMQRTLPNVSITKLERIQNEWLWTKYFQHRELIKKKNQGTAQELDLFHGTRSNPPDRIYTGEEGFDMRFSARGMWGMGNYFAVNASYSHAYAYSTGGIRQMFLVKVLVGEWYDCQSNSSLRMPPEKPTKTTSLFGVERYDSVSGTTNGSKVYIIYDNLKAYPFYLITYTA